MKREDYIYRTQDEIFQYYQLESVLQEDISKVYDEIDYIMKVPDLLGKTVQVTEKQFSDVYKIVQEICKVAGMEEVPVYVYEDFYYGAESYGTDHSWIEISSKTIQDFSFAELKFVLAREIYKVLDGVTKQKTIFEENMKMFGHVAPEKLENGKRNKFNKWYRVTNYSADNYGYLLCGDIEASVYAILKMVLNSSVLAQQINILEFVQQASEIDRMDSMVANYTKSDESIPYAPHRIHNILSYTVSERALKIVCGGDD